MEGASLSSVDAMAERDSNGSGRLTVSGITIPCCSATGPEFTHKSVKFGLEDLCLFDIKLLQALHCWSNLSRERNNGVGQSRSSTQSHGCTIVGWLSAAYLYTLTQISDEGSKVVLRDIETIIIPNVCGKIGILFIIIMSGDPQLFRVIEISQVHRLQSGLI